MPTVRILDGATGTMLERRGVDLTTSPLWASSCLVTCPGEVVAVHQAYVDAGSDAVSTCTYQLSTRGGVLSSEELTCRVRVACEMARGSGARFVHAVLGPLGACLGSNAEFTGDYLPCDALEESLATFHRPRIASVVAARALVDVLGFETLPRADEALVLAKLCTSFSPNLPPVYFSFVTLDGIHAVCGRPLALLVAELRQVLGTQLVGFGVNCSSPESCVIAAKALLGLERSDRDDPLALVVYPNAGGSYDGESRTWRPSRELTPFLCAVDEIFHAWRSCAAKSSEGHMFGDLWIGGCCNTTDSEIRTIATMRSGVDE